MFFAERETSTKRIVAKATSTTKTFLPVTIALLLAIPALSRAGETKQAASLDDLKKLKIICFVPSYLPKDFKFNRAAILYEQDQGQRVPTYAIEWSNSKKSSFSIESAWEGIGDRNLMDTEDSEEAQFSSPQFGTVYLIYTPRRGTVKKKILSNWVEDANMKADEAKKRETLDPKALGRFHGFTGTNLSVAEFEKIVNSLHPISAKEDPPPAASTIKVHPRVFSMINCWISDSESPVVTEINLDAVEQDGNEFQDDALKQDGEWTRVPNPEADGGFMRYPVLETKGNHYKVEYQENGGGTLTSRSIIEFNIEKRTIDRDGKPLAMRVLRVTSYQSK